MRSCRAFGEYSKALYRRSLRLGTAIAMLVVACGVARAQSFAGLGTLAGGTYSTGAGVSSDGSVVVGTADSAGSPRAFRWTAQGGMVSLGTLAGGSLSYGRAVSGDGSVVACFSDSAGAGERACRWTSSGGMMNLGTLGMGSLSQASSVSTDGLVVVGTSATADVATYRAFRWTGPGGMADLGTLPGGLFSQGVAASSDGSVVVGYGDTPGSARYIAFRWTDGSGLVGLGAIPGGTYSEGFAVSGDGTVVVGVGDLSGASRAFRWTSGVGMVGLGTVPGAASSSASGANADGSVVVGSLGFGSAEYRAAMWTRSLGMVDLNVYLPTLGISLAGWTLNSANAVSPDGLSIAGTGTHNGATESWVAVLPPQPPACFAVTGIANGSTCGGEAATANFTVAATGAGPLGYQWQIRNASGANDWSNLGNVAVMVGCPSGGSGLVFASQATTPAVSIGVRGCTRDRSWQVRCVVSNACGSVTSDWAMLTTCAADFNCSGGVTVQDIFDFLAAWFDGTYPVADFNDDGHINLQDVFDFLAAWFVGC